MFAGLSNTEFSAKVSNVEVHRDNALVDTSRDSDYYGQLFLSATQTSNAGAEQPFYQTEAKTRDTPAVISKEDGQSTINVALEREIMNTRKISSDECTFLQVEYSQFSFNMKARHCLAHNYIFCCKSTDMNKRETKEKQTNVDHNRHSQSFKFHILIQFVHM